MRLSLAALVACTAAVQAFKGTSPFLLFSTTQLPPSLQDASVAQIQSSQAVLDTTKQFLSSCPTDAYYIIQQPSVLPSDLSPSAVPNLQTVLSSSAVKAKYLVSETRGLGNDVKEELLAHLRKSCGSVRVVDLDAPIQTTEILSSKIAAGLSIGQKVVIVQTMKELSGARMSTQRAAMLKDIDYSNHVDLSEISKEPSFTVVWTTTPVSGDNSDVGDYEPEFQDPAHMELRRALDERVVDGETSNTTDTRPLFEKYQFFNPGLFMGLLVVVILLSILSVGLRAISSLQVSYAAFDKEMGPAAQKKQQ